MKQMSNFRHFYVYSCGCENVTLSLVKNCYVLAILLRSRIHLFLVIFVVFHTRYDFFTLSLFFKKAKYTALGYTK